MKVPVAIAVLVLVLAAHSEAQEESTLKDHFTNFQNQVKELGESIMEKAKATLQKIQDSPVTTAARNWLNEQYEKLIPKDS